MTPTWPADNVERRPIESLIPYASNARTHSDQQVAQIAASMKEWGWTNPILVDDSGLIIAGPGQAVYEPFSGSGTTIIAAEMTGRTVHAIELNPAYVDVAITRWQAFTGKAATLESIGQTFAELKEQRHGPTGAAAETHQAA